MDFGLLKRIVNEQIVSRLDHAFIIRRTEQGELLRGHARRPLLAHSPGRLPAHVREHARRLRRASARGAADEVQLYSLRLHETATSYAEWFADDNL